MAGWLDVGETICAGDRTRDRRLSRQLATLLSTVAVAVRWVSVEEIRDRGC